MKINESLNSFLKSTQKMSENMALFAKMANISKSHLSFTESFEKSQRLGSILTSQPKFYGGGEAIPKTDYLERSQKLSSILASQPKFYGGGEAIPKADYFQRTQKLISTLANHPKFYYGGGVAIDTIVDFGKNAKLRADIVVLNSVVKSNSIGLFNSSDVFSASNSKTLDTLKTFQSVSERNLSVHTARRDSLVEKISEALYLHDDFDIPKNWSSQFFHDTFHERFINHDEYLFSHFAEYIRCENEIEYENSKIKIFKKLYKSIKSGFRKFSLNKREFFRKINSFHFKNLDDYDSLPLITSVN